MADTATIRRPRGGLEELVREVCDAIVVGAAGEGPWTTHRLAREIKERFPGSGVSPSTGAIGDTLRRWSEIGFAKITDDSPLAFINYTDEATSVGLTELKTRNRKRKAAARKAAKASEAPVAEAPEPTGEPGAHHVQSWTPAPAYD